jgi:hypothetical protein
MKSYLFISKAPFPNPAPVARVTSLHSGCHLIGDDDEFAALYEKLRQAGALAPEARLLELSHPFQSMGLTEGTRGRWETTMLSALADSVQNVGDDARRTAAVER